MSTEYKKANRFTPKTLGDKRFSIPLYQRLFSWQEDNVKKLLSDLKEHFGKKPDKPYYIGMLTTCKSKKGDEYELIDGQQRMTVMILMAIVFRKHHKDFEGWKNFLNSGGRLIFTARAEDKTYLGRKIEEYEPTAGDGEQTKDEERHVNLNMEKALKAIESFLKDEYKDKNNKNKFIENVYRNLTFFIYELPDNYSNDTTLLNKYFEVMNSAGRNLEQHEILKVELLKDMGNNQDFLTAIWNAVSQMGNPIIEQNDNQDIESTYIGAIDKICSCIAGKNVSNVENVLRGIGRYKQNNDEGDDDKNKTIGKTIGGITSKHQNFENNYREKGSDSIISFEEFLLIVLDFSLEKEKKKENDFSFYQKDKLLEKFKLLTEINSEEEKKKYKEKFYLNLLYYRLLLDYYVIGSDFENGEGSYTLLMGDDGKGAEDAKKSLCQFQSMLYVSTEFYVWLKPYLAELAKQTQEEEQKQKKLDASSLLTWLKGEDNKRHPWLKGEDNNGDRVHPEEDLSYDKVDRYWFWRLDYYLWENRKKFFEDDAEGDALSVAEDYIFRYNRSIEHVAPQSPKQESSLQWGENEEEIRDSFGNLVMISSGLNSSLRNASFEEKKARVESYRKGGYSGSIESLKLLWIFTKYETWNKDNIQAHQEEMLKILKDSFKHPSNS